MRIALIILVAIHGIIHLFGFFKAFGIAEFNAISQPISKSLGIIWLMTFVLFAITTILLLVQSKYWWIPAIVGVLLSQFLIIAFWNDAKFGTILNVIILISALIAYSMFSFQEKVASETAKILENSNLRKSNIISEGSLSNLPGIVQKWLLNSGTVGTEAAHTVYLEQNAQMSMKPGQKSWSKATARQYFTVDPPAFNWSVNLKMNPAIQVVGRDKFQDGKGQMTIKLLSLFPVVDAKENEKIDQATMQRYLAEIVWFPSAALSPYINWQSIDDHSARATMAYMGTEASGVFHFDNNGEFQKFETMRYKEAADSEPTKWIVTATKTEQRNGIKIPVESEAQWELEDGTWTWLRLKITRIEYNIKEITS